MEGSRLLRLVRIAVTALSLTACVLLIALWVRSYWFHESIYQRIPNVCEIMVSHLRGEIYFSLHDIRGKLVNFSFGTHFASRKAAADFPVWPSGFYYKDSRHGAVIGVPYWFAVMTASILVAAPWIPSARRFSLRTLLIAITLVAVGLGIIVWSM